MNIKQSINSFYFLIILLFSSQVTGQDTYNRLAQKICKCLEQKNISLIKEMPSCFEDVVVENYKEIKALYNAKSMEEINTEELGNKIGVILLKECDYALKLFSNQQKQEEKIILKQENLTCESLKSGDFYYLNGRSNTSVPDTTFVTISNKIFLERMNNGRTYSLLSIDWIDDCKFELKFTESNDPFKKELSKPGDTYLYEVMTNGKESIIVKIYWKKEEFQVELFKIQ
jgi:hypothetical protein